MPLVRTLLLKFARYPRTTELQGFHKYLGISPTTYMQLRTLNRAWHQLATGSAEETTVARVATDLGIWDLGRFAMRYRMLFGELPSETLRRH